MSKPKLRKIIIESEIFKARIDCSEEFEETLDAVLCYLRLDDFIIYYSSSNRGAIFEVLKGDLKFHIDFLTNVSNGEIYQTYIGWRLNKEMQDLIEQHNFRLPLSSNYYDKNLVKPVKNLLQFLSIIDY